MEWTLMEINLTTIREVKLSESINVYWSPWNHFDVYWHNYEKYDTPDLLINYANSFKNIENNYDTWYKCRGYMELSKNTYVLRSPFDINARIVDGKFYSEYNEDSLKYLSIKDESMLNQHTINLSANWIFWCDEDITITTINPYLEKFKFDGFYVPGSFNINKWFRPVESAFQLINNENKFIIKKGDPLIYIKFNTDKKVILNKFKFNYNLHESVYKCTKYKVEDPWRSLSFLYRMFNGNNWGDVIKKNILENLSDKN